MDIGGELNEFNRMYWLRRFISLVVLVLMLPWGAYFHAAKASQMVGSFVGAPEAAAFGAQSRIRWRRSFSTHASDAIPRPCQGQVALVTQPSARVLPLTRTGAGVCGYVYPPALMRGRSDQA